MSLEKPSRKTSDSEPPATEKKAYEKPSFVREEVFETMALACGKVNPGQCKGNRKNS